MTADGAAGVTCVGHDSEEPVLVNGFETPGSFARNISYRNASMSQIIAIINASERCEQYLKYHCHASFINRFGTQYAWWESRDGTKMDYWAGGTAGSMKCACGIKGTCMKGGACNCDNNTSTVVDAKHQ